ncbi:uncharacterized protein NECHADRAFT_52669 [Fusarium vanettenii 77-13-4]|uniref:Metallo-beta-lactamase domain-containing protein n=1 Tax=Fusarium vanettenii (strain ATCC MYA-4622 / CBS 123669 / FGSC 9596 / NRRL 45880 / 77-13-4) TaxID=660122 RepID=C7ZI56_FUSV7|nr:uncharacterized protein NECHADRAFT_52669 [Fusarium vanettenii 77-13-4]EEU36317.1 hypothetical protein NECHADRAFT_52669 [Fusarium vanettenii 77-13-4]
MTLQTSDDLLICTNCGTQYAETSNLPECRICEDPRQCITPAGQTWTTLKELKAKGHKNAFERQENDSKVVEIWTEPKFAIGQGSCFIQTPHGNVMWDCIAFLDQDTVNKINELGGLKFIVISHPHMYTTWADWSRTFKCPVYVSEPDSIWINRRDAPGAELRIITDKYTELLPGLTTAICGGHFDGSMVMHSAVPNTDLPSLFVTDTIFIVASGHNPDPGKRSDIISYQFLRSFPNIIPLAPDVVLQIWRSLKPFEFKATYGVWAKVMNNCRWTLH